MASKVVLTGIKRRERVLLVCSFGTGINAWRLCCRGIIGTEEEGTEGTGLLCGPAVESKLNLECRVKPLDNDLEM